MKKSIAATFAMTLALAAFAPQSFAADAKKGGSAVLVPASDLKWSDVPGFKGLQLAVVEGNPAKGTHRSMIKFEGGFAAPLHHHTSNHFVTVVAGTLVLTVDGKEHRLPAGSYFSFKDKKQHMTRCEAGAACILSLDVRGKWDVVPEKSKPAAKK
jgi:quercetin dioxygenase-like cupin family protein